MKSIIILLLILNIELIAQESYYPISKKGKWGIIDSVGNVILEPKHDYLSPFNNNVAIIKKKNKYGLLNTNNEIITPTDYEEIIPIKSNYKGGHLYLVKKEKQGIISNTGTEITPLKYTEVKTNKDYYFGENENKEIEVGSFKKGILFTKTADSITSLKHLFFKSYNHNSESLLDNKGQTLFKGKTLNLETKNNGHIIHLKKNKMLFFDTKYKKLIDTNLTLVSILNKIYNFEDSNNVNHSFSFLFNRFFKNKGLVSLKQYGEFIVVNNNDLFGVLDSNGNLIVPFQYKEIKWKGSFFYGITLENKTALYTDEFKLLVPALYNNVEKKTYGYEYRINNKIGVLDKNGKKITEAIFNYINEQTIPIKCYLPNKGAVHLLFDSKWNYKSKKEFKNFLTLSTKKLPRKLNTEVTSDFGWFLDTVTIIKKDTILKLPKWGLKDTNNTIVTKPIYKEYIVRNDSFSYAYKGKSVMKKSEIRINDIPVGASFNLVNHLSGEIMNRNPFYKFKENDFLENNIARGLSRNGIGLYNRKLKTIEEKLHYAFPPQEGMILYSKLNKEISSDFINDRLVFKGFVWDELAVFESFSPIVFREYITLFQFPLIKQYISKNIKFGYYNSKESTKIYPPQFDYASLFNKGVAFVGVKNKDEEAVYGVTSKDSIIVPLIYVSANYFEPNNYDSLYIVKLNNGERLMLDTLLNAKQLSLTNINRVSDNVIIARKKNKFGILDDNLNWVVNPGYKKIIPTETEKLLFKEKTYGILASTGDRIISPSIRKKYIVPLSKGALVYNNRSQKGKVFYFDYKYGQLFKPFSGVVFESDSLLLKVSNNKPVYYKNGLEINTNKLFYYTTLFENKNYIISKKRKNTKIINRFSKEKIVLKNVIIQDIANEGIYYIENDCKGLLNYNGDTLIKALGFSEITKNSDGFLVTRSKIDKRKYKYGLQTTAGKLILPCEFLKIEKIFDSIYFCFKKKGTSVFLSTKGDTIKTINCNSFEVGEFFLYRSGKRAYFLDNTLTNIFKYNFIDARPFVQGIATVKTREGWQVINNKGNIISMGCFETLESIANNTIIAQEKPKFGLYNYKGENVIPVEYETIKGVSSSVIQVIKKGKVGYINTNGNWIYNPF